MICTILIQSDRPLCYFDIAAAPPKGLLTIQRAHRFSPLCRSSMVGKGSIAISDIDPPPCEVRSDSDDCALSAHKQTVSGLTRW